MCKGSRRRILRSLKEQSIGWHHSDAEGSGKTLLTALSKALQYSLPFDLQGALSRRGMHIPERFMAEKLNVQPPKRNVATRDDTVDEKLRLETQRLLDHARRSYSIPRRERLYST